MSSSPSLTIALLVFNEEQNIAQVLNDTRTFCLEHLSEWEIIVVDDGSTDHSVGVIEPYTRLDSRIRLVSHSTNRGMGAGIRTAITQSQKEYFTFNAADGQIAAAELGKLLPLLSHADIVLSTYANRRESWGREMMSRGFRLYLRALAQVKFKLQGLYLFPTAIAQTLAAEITADTFFFNFALIQQGLERGLRAETTTINCRPRSGGRSRVVNGRRIARVARETLQYGICRRLRTPPR